MGIVSPQKSIQGWWEKKANKSATIYTPVKKTGAGARGVRGARGKQEQIVTRGHTIKKKIPRGET